MIGQQLLEDAVEINVLALLSDGTKVGWRILHPRKIWWQHTGVQAGSSHARLVVEGEFHRRQQKARLSLHEGEDDGATRHLPEQR